MEIHSEYMLAKHRNRQMIAWNLALAVVFMLLGGILHSVVFPSVPIESVVAKASSSVDIAPPVLDAAIVDSLSVNFVPVLIQKQLPDLAAENNFLTTMRSCLGEFCFDEAVSVTDKNSINLVRIGILAPELSGAATFLKMLEKFNGKNKKVRVELVHTMNVPPYGYGKNHGWSRIIRIARRIVPHAHHLLAKHTALQGAGNISLLIDPQIRQLMRWHCRLSHVAAHTSMLTIFTDDYLRNPNFEFEKMLSFVGLKESRGDIAETVKAFSEELLAEFGSEDSYNPSIVSNSFYEQASAVIQSEMTATKDLANWPCPSFKLLSHQNELVMSAASLVANCSAPYVKCSVGFDLKGG